jgi:hypothetical protein
MSNNVKPASGCTVEGLVGFYNEVKAALYATPEFDSFECDYGPALGECTNDNCLHCRVKRALDNLNPNTSISEISKEGR